MKKRRNNILVCYTFTRVVNNEQDGATTPIQQSVMGYSFGFVDKFDEANVSEVVHEIAKAHQVSSRDVCITFITKLDK